MTAERSIAYLTVPEFGAAVARHADPAVTGRPLVLLDDRGTVLAVDALAVQAGIAPGQTEHQAVARCPAAAVRPASRYPLVEAQAALVARVACYAERWQPVGPGRVYLDITGLRGDKVTWAQALSAEVRGLDVTPALGLTCTKFGAQIAGQIAGRNVMLLLGQIVLRSFLAIQPAALLPLDADALLHLRHLGIRTLGQFAHLPAAGVLVRFGEAGRTAQRWAQGYDERPVILPDELPEVSTRIEFDAPVSDRDILLATLMRCTTQLLQPLRARLQAVGRLALAVTRGDNRVLPAAHAFSLPTAASESIRLALSSALDRVPWEGEGASEITLILADITDAPVHQLSLFEVEPTPRATLTATLNHLAARFGPDTFRMAVLTDPSHPLPEHRTSWQAFG